MGDVRTLLIPHSEEIRKSMGDCFGVNLSRARARPPVWEKLEERLLDKLLDWETKSWPEPDQILIEAQKTFDDGNFEFLEFTIRKQEFAEHGFIALGRGYPSHRLFDWFVETCESLFGDVYIFDSQDAELWLLKDYGSYPPPESP